MKATEGVTCTRSFATLEGAVRDMKAMASLASRDIAVALEEAASGYYPKEEASDRILFPIYHLSDMIREFERAFVGCLEADLAAARAAVAVHE